jgi:hypothetical protein
MKARISFLLLSLGLTAIVIYSSCTKVHQSFRCENGAAYQNGVCQCPAGTEGATCGTISRDKLLGGWIAVDTTDPAHPLTYPVTIVAGPGIADIQFKNFNNAVTLPVNATVNTLAIAIPGKVYGDWSVVGNAYYDPYSNIIEMRYRVADTHLWYYINYGFNPGTTPVILHLLVF